MMMPEIIEIAKNLYGFNFKVIDQLLSEKVPPYLPRSVNPNIIKTTGFQANDSNLGNHIALEHKGNNNLTSATTSSQLDINNMDGDTTAKTTEKTTAIKPQQHK
ncbi:hypothetical protein ACTA71_008832 [Dictyostelium dimigraforme]